MDVSTLSLSKSYTDNVAAGITAARVEGNTIVLTLVDGSEARCDLPVPADGKDGKDGISVVDLSIDKDGSLLCHMSNGTTIDAGYVPTVDPDLTNYYTKSEVNQKIADIDIPNPDLSVYYTKEEVNQKIAAIPSTDLSNYYTKEEVNSAINAAITTVLEGEF